MIVILLPDTHCTPVEDWPGTKGNHLQVYMNAEQHRDVHVFVCVWCPDVKFLLA